MLESILEGVKLLFQSDSILQGCINLVAILFTTGAAAFGRKKLTDWAKEKKIINDKIIDGAADFAYDVANNWAKHQVATGGEKPKPENKLAHALSTLSEKTGLPMDSKVVKNAMDAAVTRAKRAKAIAINPR